MRFQITFFVCLDPASSDALRFCALNASFCVFYSQSSPATHSFKSGRASTLHFAVQRLPADTQLSGGFRDVSRTAFKGVCHRVVRQPLQGVHRHG